MPVMKSTEVTREAEGERASAALRAPVRGTQSFVGVLGRIWSRPGLTGLEVLWRWGAGIPLLLLAWRLGSQALLGIHLDLRTLNTADFLLKPAVPAIVFRRALAMVLPPLEPVAYWLVPLAIVLWTLAAAVGRTWIWRRLDASVRSHFLLAGSFALLRLLALLVTYGAWFWGMAAAEQYAILAPAETGQEPNLVLYAALAVALTLFLFLLWSLTSWLLDAAPLFAMCSWANAAEGTSLGFAASLRSAFHARALRSKLIETNLVMGIIKVALLVLAMVFSASPLPFVSVETPAFLRGWWTFVGVLFVVALDFFHVVRRAAYLELFRTLVTPGGDTTPGTETVS